MPSCRLRKGDFGDFLQAGLTASCVQDDTLEYARTLPEGSFGHAYAQFMGKRKCGLARPVAGSKHKTVRVLV